jgi:ADP-ribose pyrophosphatase
MAKTKKQPKVRVLKSRVVFRGRVFEVTSDVVMEPTGIRVRRDTVRHPGSVVILAVDSTGSQPRVLLERQFRYCAGDFLWELPAGTLDPGEDELSAAKRELLEETGYTAERWQFALKFFASPGITTETMAVYLAEGLRRGKAQPEADEVIRKRMFSVFDAVRMILRGKIRDGKTIAGILWLKQRRT